MEAASEDLVMHTHCETCITSQCSVKVVPSCAVINCELKCGFRFHACKSHEHSILCANMKVSCINEGYGCPMILPRSKLGSHLEKCPASVVVCTMKWNRQDVPTAKELQTMIMKHRRTFSHSEYLLGLALAWRDSRVVQRTLEALSSCDAQIDPAWYCAYPWVILPKKAMKLQLKPGPSSPGSDSVIDPAICDHDYVCIYKARQAICRRVHGLNSTVSPGEDNRNRGIDISGQDCRYENNEYEGVLENCDQGMSLANGSDPFLGKEVENKNIDPVLSVGNEDQNNSPIGHQFLNSCGSAVYPGNNTVCVDLTVDTYAGFHSKPRDVYTFICAEEFRRDEFAMHYKNVHGDIYSGLNGWIERKCPLAGCTFGVTRLDPSSKDCPKEAFISYNVGLNGLCVVPCAELTENGTDNFENPVGFDLNQDGSALADKTIGLDKLPFEVLTTILKFLDAYSLRSLALTSHYFRAVCGSMLCEKGLVVQRWMKDDTWKIKHQAWLFSTAFTSIQSWKFNDIGTLANHMKYCPFFERLRLPCRPFCPHMGLQSHTTT